MHGLSHIVFRIVEDPLSWSADFSHSRGKNAAGSRDRISPSGRGEFQLRWNSKTMDLDLKRATRAKALELETITTRGSILIPPSHNITALATISLEMLRLYLHISESAVITTCSSVQLLPRRQPRARNKTRIVQKLTTSEITRRRAVKGSADVSRSSSRRYSSRFLLDCTFPIAQGRLRGFSRSPLSSSTYTFPRAMQRNSSNRQDLLNENFRGKMYPGTSPERPQRMRTSSMGRLQLPGPTTTTWPVLFLRDARAFHLNKRSAAKNDSQSQKNIGRTRRNENRLKHFCSIYIAGLHHYPEKAKIESEEIIEY
ncbi:unnamed protein product [Nesidiocoris tenuis]|uniref:Uncharacterized protein n=1 Tax=Nesidiocoris tenuis TaxID=355587 RepID=A0A6H5H4I4_9HEMI|nr:unnamed protein product [Nesidiocoris tenuis]